MADIFQEVEEDIRRDRFQALWRRFGRLVIAGLVLIVVATIAAVWWDDYRQSQRLDNGKRFAAAVSLLDAGQAEAAALEFSSLAADSDGGLAALARLRAADALIRAGDVAGAVAAYDALSADGDAPQELRDLAVVLSGLHRLDLGTAKDHQPKLQALIDDGGPWRHLAMEIQALIALSDGDTEGARQIFQELAEDAAAPGGVRQRAQEILAAIDG